MVDDIVGLGRSLKAIERMTREARELIQSFAGPPMEELGQLFADKIRGRRLINTLKVFQKGKQLLLEQGLEPQAVNFKILNLLIEGSSLEDEEILVSKWSGLLATAATPTGIHPSYPKILSELTSFEARMLDALYQWNEEYPFTLEDWTQQRFTVVKLIEQLGSTETQIKFGIHNTKRLGLTEDASVGTILQRYLVHTWILRLTDMGQDFVGLCNGPKREKK